MSLAIVCVLGCSSSDEWSPPESFSSFEAQVKREQLTKVDLLFAIDDSPSMADKGGVLADQLGAMVSRFLSPRCVSRQIYCTQDADCSALGPQATCERDRCFGANSALGVCPTGLEPEIAPIRDLHVGVVRSSLACGDAGRLFAGTIDRAKPVSGNGGGFLAWLPRSVAANVNKPAPNVTAYSDNEDGALIADFRTLVSEVGSSGCGFESQLESWYRFLIQPDPYASIATGNGAATLVGVDSTLLAMRRDFLRPDSLVVIVQITDEDDGSIDPLATGATFMRKVPLGPRGTSACDGDPSSPACSSCALPENATDPSCVQQSWYASGQDSLDVRFGDDTKRRYGLDPLWSVQRYVDGLRLSTAPDRAKRNCKNPLFARGLPDGSDTSAAALCDLPLGERTPDLVFYALIGGVAPSLLVDTKGSFKLDLAPDDWAKLTGSKRDPHMIESIAPRASLPLPSATYGLGSDPDIGREWNTTNATGVGDRGTSVDFQFACTFDLPAPRDCSIESPCDCVSSAPDGPPLCDPNERTMQVRGKAYPSIRELRVAQGLGMQAVVRSTCTPWMPVLTPVIYRLVPLADQQCFSEVLHRSSDCSVSCQMLVVYPSQTNQSAGCTDPGTSQPDKTTLDYYRREYIASLGDAAAFEPLPVVCAYRQLVGAQAGCSNPSPDYTGPTCESSPRAGWCYVTNAPGQGCPQDIAYGADGPPAGTVDVLYCLQR